MINHYGYRVPSTTIWLGFRVISHIITRMSTLPYISCIPYGGIQYLDGIQRLYIIIAALLSWLAITSSSSTCPVHFVPFLIDTIMVPLVS